MKPKSLLILLIFVVLLAMPASATQIQTRIHRKRKTRKLFVISGLLVFGIGCFLVAGVCAVKKYQNIIKIIKLHDTFITYISDLRKIFNDAMNLSCSRLSSASSLNTKTLTHLNFTINAIKVTQNISDKEGDFDALMDQISNLPVPETKSGLTFLEDQTTENKSFYQTILDSLKTPFKIFTEKPENDTKVFNEITSFELLYAMEDAAENMKRIIEKDDAVRKTICFDSVLIDKMNYHQQVSFQAIDKTARELEASNDLISLFMDPSDYRDTWLRNAQQFAPEKASDIEEAIKKNTIWWRIVRVVLKVGSAAVSKFVHIKLSEKGIPLTVITELARSTRQIKEFIQNGDSKHIMNELEEIGKNIVFDMALKSIAKAFSVSFSKVVIPAKILITGVISLVKSYKEVKKTEKDLREKRKEITKQVNNAVIFANFKTTAANRAALINYNLMEDVIEQGIKSIDLNCEEDKKIEICKADFYFCGIYYGKEFAKAHSSSNRLCANNLTMLESKSDSTDIYHKGFEAISSEISEKFKVSPTFSSLDSNLIFVSTQTSKLSSPDLEEAYKKNPTIKKHSTKIISKTIQLQEDQYLHVFAISKQNMTPEMEADICPLASTMLDQIPSTEQKEINIDNKLAQIKKDNKPLLRKVCDAIKYPEQYFTDDDKHVIRQMVVEHFERPSTQKTYKNIGVRSMTELRPIHNRKYKMNILDGIRIGFDMAINRVVKPYDSGFFGSLTLSFTFIQVDPSSNEGLHSFDSAPKSECNETPFFDPTWMGKEIFNEGNVDWKSSRHGQDLFHFTSRRGSRDSNVLRLEKDNYVEISRLLYQQGFTFNSERQVIQPIGFFKKMVKTALFSCPYFFQSSEVVIEGLDPSKGYSFNYVNKKDFALGSLKVVESEEKELLFENKFIMLVYFTSDYYGTEAETSQIFTSTLNKFRYMGYYPLRAITDVVPKSSLLEAHLIHSAEVGYVTAEIFVKPFKSEGAKEVERICDSY